MARGSWAFPWPRTAPTWTASKPRSRKARPKLFYTIPDFQNPAGATCSGPKRRRIAELAERHDFLIVEDAPYRQLRYRGDGRALALLARARADASR